VRLFEVRYAVTCHDRAARLPRYTVTMEAAAFFLYPCIETTLKMAAAHRLIRVDMRVKGIGIRIAPLDGRRLRTRGGMRLKSIPPRSI